MKQYAAVVTQYLNPEDTEVNIMIECLTCNIEWGWSKDTNETYNKLVTLAKQHVKVRQIWRKITRIIIACKNEILTHVRQHYYAGTDS